MRWIRHLVANASVRRQFPRAALDAIHQAISVGEQHHDGQVCFAIEQALPLRDLTRHRTPRDRAQDVFAQLRVWDTEHNCGVLIYVLLAERAIEIVADRGIAARVAAAEWQAVCERMRERFAATEYRRGALEGIEAVSAILSRHFPAGATPRANELPDAPVVL